MGVTVAVVRAALNTSTGTQDFTTADLGGLTPKAAILIATRATADGTAADGAGWYTGFTDGTNHHAVGLEEQHAQASSDAQINQVTNILTIYDGTADEAVDAAISFSSWLTNGIRINITDAPTSAFLLTVILFAGTDLSASVGNQDLGTGTSGIDITSVGFEADVVFTLYGITTTTLHWCMGLIHNDRAGTVTQRNVVARVRNARPTMENMSVTLDDSCLAICTIAGVSGKLVASAFDSSGFTVTPSASFASADLLFLALRFGSSPVVSSKVYTFSTPTATGDNTDTNPGFEPQAVIYLTGLNETINTFNTDTESYSLGLSCITTNAQYHNTVSSEDNVADSNTQSLSDNQAVNLPLHTGAAGLAATFSAFTSTGVTLNWSDVEANAKRWGGLAIGAAATGTTITPAAAIAASSAVAPTVVKGSLSVTPTQAQAAASAIAPTAIKGSVSITPAVAQAAASAIAPTVVIGGAGTSITPPQAEADTSAIAPSIVLGSVSLTPSQAGAASSAIAPTTIKGSLSITPAQSIAAATAIAPTVIKGSIVREPAWAQAGLTAYAPTKVFGSATITPVAAIIIALAIAPIVQVETPGGEGGEDRRWRSLYAIPFI